MKKYILMLSFICFSQLVHAASSGASAGTGSDDSLTIADSASGSTFRPISGLSLPISSGGIDLHPADPTSLAAGTTLATASTSTAESGRESSAPSSILTIKDTLRSILEELALALRALGSPAETLRLQTIPPSSSSAERSSVADTSASSTSTSSGINPTFTGGVDGNRAVPAAPLNSASKVTSRPMRAVSSEYTRYYGP